MNNTINYADFIEMSVTSDEEFEPYGYSSELETGSSNTYESANEKRIENMLLSHSKYHVYCE